MAILSCHKKQEKPQLPLTQAPTGFPAIPFPTENPYTDQKWAMGKKLFYDKALSVDNSISCASCHHPSLAFSDSLPKSLGAAGLTGRRNAPSLANVAYHPYYTREGSVPTLEMQILVPVQEHDEFNFNIVDIAERLKKVPEYDSLSHAIFGREMDAYVITRAIATFERTLISGNSAYDKYTYKSDDKALTDAEKRGLDLFNGKAGCSGCHSGFNLTNYSFENNGLYETYADSGRAHFTNLPADRGKFKVPTLRNIALTAPYMHDGSLATLQQVVDHYNSGGKPHPNKSTLITPLNLSAQEQADLITFLHSLSDYDFVNEPRFRQDK